MQNADVLIVHVHSQLIDLAIAQTALLPLAQDHTVFWQITQFILVVQPYKLQRKQTYLDQGFPVCWKFQPPLHRSHG